MNRAIVDNIKFNAIPALCLLLIVFIASRLSRSDYQTDSFIEAELNQLSEVMLKGLEANKQSCAARVDAEGNIDWCNERFETTFGIGVGDNIEDVIPEDYRDDHHTQMGEAIRAHAAGERTTYNNFDTMAILADGERSPVHVRAWTIREGAMAFVDVLGD